ncbi:hypothetical protein EVAR_15709_1 [Eumeta japonica]|uniref:Uncharacterized protein n=1 Tax=Eumeta variegata TaxID=151549 RepID=A0A4C1U9F5_EUMVA|nr:hypothetical protein EVAR_15709_1 [Eumeta japonica]
MRSFYQIYFESSWRSRTARPARAAGACARGTGTAGGREMFQLMYFPVGRKTHVVAFNLMRVTLRAARRVAPELVAISETISSETVPLDDCVTSL